MSGRRTRLLASLALLAMAACWGSTFFLIKDLLDRVPTLDFLAVRFAIAGLTMVVVAPRALRRLSPRSRRSALVLGAVYGLAQIAQPRGWPTPRPASPGSSPACTWWPPRSSQPSSSATGSRR